MTSTRAPIDLHAETELHRRIHAESPYWDMMYKALLNQLTDYIELTVAQALESHGIGPRQGFTAQVAAGQAQPPLQAARTSTPDRPVRHAEPVVPRPGKPRAGDARPTPPWLQPFTLPEKVRFTRTPDAFLRIDRPASSDAEPHPLDETGLVALPEPMVSFDPDLPAWRRPFTLPPNVRINRTPAPRPPEMSPKPMSAEMPALPIGPDVPSWLGIIRTEPDALQPVDEQDNSSVMPDMLEGHDGAFTDDMIAAAWLTSLEEMSKSRPVAVSEPIVPDAAQPATTPNDPLSMQDTILALLDHASDKLVASGMDARSPRDRAGTDATTETGEPGRPGAANRGTTTGGGEAKPAIKPTGIASPEDARAFIGPNRATSARRGAPHGLAPFEQPNHVVLDPALWEDPPLELLALPPEPTGETLSSGALEQNARLLEGVLEEFGVRGEIIDVRPGPVVTLYELEPAPGTKSSRVIGLSDDIARSMSAVSARVAVVQGRNVIGIELPNQRRETVFLRELVASEDFDKSKHKLAIALGKTIGGEPVIVDLARMPHLLVAGTTGSGKSVAINTMILSLLYRLKPEECRLIMIDPKMLELSVYEGIPHLLTPVVTDPKKAVVALKWAVREMEDRYKKMSKVGVRNIDGFNARVAEAEFKGETITRTVQTGYNRESGEPIFESEAMELSPLPYIVVIVDEMADLMMVAGKDIEGAIQRLAQMARAAGIHLIMATQRPSVDVITGTIKANFPTRISFQVTSKIDSRTILGEQGAEQLLGQGDMLHMAGGGRISRVHGPFVSDGEVEKVVAHLKTQGHPTYLDVVVADEDGGEPKTDGGDDKPVYERGAYGDEDNDLYEQAVKVVLRDKKCSTSYIQRRLQVGYNKAASLVERMEKEGLVGQANNAGKREILVYSRDLRFTESREGED